MQQCRTNWCSGHLGRRLHEGASSSEPCAGVRGGQELQMVLPAMLGQLAGEERATPPRTRRDRAQLQEVHAV
eukprot:2965389-Pyramimonas_sp.AAC.1